MLAAVLEEFGRDPVMAEIEPAEIRPDEVLVRVTDSGICHSDRTVQLGAQRDRPLPLVLGHESAGVVEQVGSDVHDIAIGDHVVGSASAFCGRCLWCLRGQTQHCVDKGNARPDATPRMTLAGAPVHAFSGLGGFATHMLVRAGALVTVPDEMPLDQAALLGCAVLTGIGAVRHRARVAVGETVAVIGCGGVGLNVIQAAKLAGAQRIVAIDVVPAKLRRAALFGATDLVDASATDPVQAVRDLTGGGVHHAFEVVGVGSTVEQAIAMCDVRGTTTIVGVAHPEARATVAPVALMATEKRIQGSRMGSGNFRVDVPLYCQMYLQGMLMLDELVSEVIDLSAVGVGLAALDGSDGARSVVHFD